MVTTKCLETLNMINKEIGIPLELGDLLVGNDADVHFGTDETFHITTKTWYYTLVEINGEYYILDCTKDGRFRTTDICKERSLQYLGKEEIKNLIGDMRVVGK